MIYRVVGCSLAMVVPDIFGDRVLKTSDVKAVAEYKVLDIIHDFFRKTQRT